MTHIFSRKDWYESRIYALYKSVEAIKKSEPKIPSDCSLSISLQLYSSEIRRIQKRFDELTIVSLNQLSDTRHNCIVSLHIQ